MSDPIVTIALENGQVMTGVLYPEKAPNTVRNFISLANSGFYDGLIFHRCIPGFMIPNIWSEVRRAHSYRRLCR